MAKLRQLWQDFKLLATQRFEPRISGLVCVRRQRERVIFQGLKDARTDLSRDRWTQSPEC